VTEKNCIISFITCIPNKIKLTIKSGRIRWAEHVEYMAAKRNACRVHGGKTRRKVKIIRPSC
jgi:hypothetical protein